MKYKSTGWRRKLPILAGEILQLLIDFLLVMFARSCRRIECLLCICLNFIDKFKFVRVAKWTRNLVGGRICLLVDSVVKAEFNHDYDIIFANENILFSLCEI